MRGIKLGLGTLTCLCVIVGASYGKDQTVEELQKEIQSLKAKIASLEAIIESQNKEIEILRQKSQKVTTSPVETMVGTGKWTCSRSTSPMDDSETVTLRLEAETTLKSTFGKEYKSVLCVRWKEGRTEIYIILGQMPDLGGESGKCRIRFDNRKAKQATFGMSTDREAIFWRGRTSTIIRDLLVCKRLKLEFTPYLGSPQIIIFDLRGLRQIMRPLAKKVNIDIDSIKDPTQLQLKVENYLHEQLCEDSLGWGNWYLIEGMRLYSEFDITNADIYAKTLHQVREMAPNCTFILTIYERSYTNPEYHDNQQKEYEKAFSKYGISDYLKIVRIKGSTNTSFLDIRGVD